MRNLVRVFSSIAVCFLGATLFQVFSDSVITDYVCYVYKYQGFAMPNTRCIPLLDETHVVTPSRCFPLLDSTTEDRLLNRSADICEKPIRTIIDFDSPFWMMVCRKNAMLFSWQAGISPSTSFHCQEWNDYGMTGESMQSYVIQSSIKREYVGNMMAICSTAIMFVFFGVSCVWSH